MEQVYVVTLVVLCVGLQSDTLATTTAGYPPPPLTSFYGGMLSTKCFRHQFRILHI